MRCPKPVKHTEVNRNPPPVMFLFINTSVTEAVPRKRLEIMVGITWRPRFGKEVMYAHVR